MKLKLFAVQIPLFLVLASTAQAATIFDGQAPNTLYENFIVEVDKIQSSEHSIVEGVGVYKDLDSNPIFFEGYSSEGVSKKSTASSTFYDSRSSLVYEQNVKKKVYSTPMNVITDKGSVFISFPDASSKVIKNKWINVPTDQYEEMGLKLGIPQLFDVALIEEGSFEKKIMDLSVLLARKHNLYAHYTEGINDDYEVPNATRYDLVYNSNALMSYYKELFDSLDSDERSKTIFAVEGFEKLMKEGDFIQGIADYSYTSLWIDNSTQLPVRMLSVTTLPPYGKLKEYIILTSDISWKDINKPIIIERPNKSTVSMADATKALKIKMDDKNAVTLKRVEVFQKQLKKTKNASDKGLLNYQIADEYESIGMYPEAVKFYKKAATLFPKGSIDYYESLAQAEWTVGNDKKVKEYYELALLKEPEDDYILNQYGWFLTGLTPAPKGQDLVRAQSINTLLVKNVVDDSNLMNLYVTYLLLDRTKEAEGLKERFDNFETANNYNVLARLYHRLGDSKKVDEYAKLAADKGYVRSANDNLFFGLSF